MSHETYTRTTYSAGCREARNTLQRWCLACQEKFEEMKRTRSQEFKSLIVAETDPFSKILSCHQCGRNLFKLATYNNQQDVMQKLTTELTNALKDGRTIQIYIGGHPQPNTSRQDEFKEFFYRN